MYKKWNKKVTSSEIWTHDHRFHSPFMIVINSCKNFRKFSYMHTDFKKRIVIRIDFSTVHIGKQSGRSVCGGARCRIYSILRAAASQFATRSLTRQLTTCVFDSLLLYIFAETAFILCFFVYFWMVVLGLVSS